MLSIIKEDLKDSLMSLFYFPPPKLQKHDKEEEDSPAFWRSEEEMAAEAEALRVYFSVFDHSHSDSFLYTMEYYSAEKNNNIMKFAGKWKELENIILSEVTQTQKDKHGWNLPSSAFCKPGFVDRYCSNLVLSWNVLFTPSMVGPFHGVPDFLDILFYDLFGFGVFLDCRIYFLY
ncbi:hypothetical protein STEG23_036966, partial [Scotinomys teguina]